MSPLRPQAPLPFERDHDLPPLWDGFYVGWQPWKRWRGHLCARGRATTPGCAQCGSTAAPLTANGAIWADPGGTVIRHVRGRGQRLNMGRLFAVRCRDCGHDTVSDSAGQMWDLDESDYTDTGSRAR